MKIALAQCNPSWEDRGRNLIRAEAFVKRASRAHSDLIVFPEMFSTGFSMHAGLAEQENGKTTRTLAGLAKACRISIIAGYPLLFGPGRNPQNAAVAFDRSGEIICRYGKINPFPLAGEDRVFRAGHAAVVFEIEGLAVSVFICYDLRFPEVFRAIARDVQAIFVIANWPTSRKDHWTTLLRARAIENQCYVIGVNRVGKDANRISYPGLSAIIDPFGIPVFTAGSRAELGFGTIDPAIVSDARDRYPFLRDMKP